LVYSKEKYSWTGHDETAPIRANDFRNKLAHLKTNDVIYLVLAELYGTAEQEASSAPRKLVQIATIEMESQPFPSLFGDFKLFFGHELKHSDL
jgi:hypothetical protein